jgi:hypothetical protein
MAILLSSCSRASATNILLLALQLRSNMCCKGHQAQRGTAAEIMLLALVAAQARL